METNKKSDRPSVRPAALEDYESILLEPYTYLSQVPGKDVRTVMIEAFNQWLAIPDDKLRVVQHIIGRLHNSSLLVDDIEDNSKLRRGVPVAHSIYGVAPTINAANYVYFLAFEEACAMQSYDALRAMTEELLELHRGQGKDIYWRESNTCPSEGEYVAMVVQKTGGLFRLGVKLMQLHSANKSDFTPLLNNLGLYFQVRDDYINLVDSQYMQQKSYCEDISEGKLSFPIIHAVLADTTNRQLMNILRNRTEDVNVKRHFIEYMESMGSFEYTRKYLEELVGTLRCQIAELGGNLKLENLIEKLSQSHQQSNSPAQQ